MFFQVGSIVRNSPLSVTLAVSFHRHLWLRPLPSVRRLCMLPLQMSNLLWSGATLNPSSRCWGRKAHLLLCLGFYLISTTLLFFWCYIFCLCTSVEECAGWFSGKISSLVAKFILIVGVQILFMNEWMCLTKKKKVLLGLVPTFPSRQNSSVKLCFYLGK